VKLPLDSSKRRVQLLVDVRERMHTLGSYTRHGRLPESTVDQLQRDAEWLLYELDQRDAALMQIATLPHGATENHAVTAAQNALDGAHPTAPACAVLTDGSTGCDNGRALLMIDVPVAVAVAARRGDLPFVRIYPGEVDDGT
jgi:hypothetical protein